MQKRISSAIKLLASNKGSRRGKARRRKSASVLTFEKLEVRNLLTGAVVFNELMYNPDLGQAFEFVELYNQLAVDVDISRWTIENGIDFTIPQGTVIGGGEFLVIAAEPASLATTGVAGAMGPFSGQASNSGETIELRDQNERLIDELGYSDSGLWPVAADGSGASLSKIAINLASEDPASWAASSVVGGTPGAENTFVADLPAINEVQSLPGDYQIEIYNGSSQAVNLSGYVLTQSGDFDHEVTLAGSIPVPAEGYYTISAHTLGFTPAFGDKLFLSTPGKSNVADAAEVTGALMARDDSGRFQVPNQATLGSENTFSFHDDIVINEIQYHNAPQFGVAAEQTGSTEVPYAEYDLEWIELHNRSSQAVSVAGWELDEAVSFEFSLNTSIAAGSYLVVTNDRVAFLAEHPAVNPAIVLGDFGGRLSNQSERITLLDDVGNLADEVTYFDGGRWAGAADGGGSTLELIDSDSNNSVAEAWAASDESSKSPWVTYTYTGIAGVLNANNYPDASNNTGGSDNETTEFNEFIFGLLESGEVLLDDLSVIDRPSGPAIELLQDGSFESNSATSGDPRLSVDTYRVLGTHGSHGLTGIVADPDDPSNSVFRLVSTGATDHVYNHVETTFANNTPIVNGREYQISFRAKWISGTPLFNTRLYFNKVAQTTTLETPDAAGTPGAANSVAVVNAGPTFTNFEQSIAVPAIGQDVQIVAEASDNDGVASMTLFWSVDEGSYQSASMALNPQGQYVASIPGQSLNSVVQFYASATDTLGATSTYPAEGADSRALLKVLDALPTAGGQVVIEDFSGNLSNWTNTVILDHNGGGSNVSNWVINGGELELSTTSYDGIEQHAFIYDGLTLGVGDEIQLDMSDISGDRNLGLYVGGTEPTTGVREDYIAVYGAINGSIATRGFDGLNQYNNPTTNPSSYDQVFIARTALSEFEIGYYSAGVRSVLTTRTPSFANDATYVGIYADVRSTGTLSGNLDNLTLKTAATTGLGTITPTGAPSFRIIMTEADRTFLHENTNVMSNDGMLATVVYNNSEVYHNVDVRLKSSLRGRWDDTRLGFTVKFDPTHLFNGIHETVNIDRSGAGRGSPTDYFGQAEIISWHILNQAGGVPGFQNDFVYFEQPRAGTSEGQYTEGSAQLVLTAYRNDYLDSAYEDGSDGKLFKFSSIYATDTEMTVGGDPEGFKTNGRRFNQVFTTPLQDLGDDPESYRYNYLIENNESQNDLSPVINLAKTFSLSQAQFNAVIDDVIDVDQFLRVAAAMSLIGAGDNFFSGTDNNLQLYQRPGDGKFEFFPWDNDTQRGVSTSASLVGNSEIQKVINVSSTNQRNYYSHLMDIMNSTFNTSYMAAWSAHYESFTTSQNGAFPGNQDFGEILSFIGSRNNYVTNQLNGLGISNAAFEITTNNGNSFGTGQNTVTIRGTGNLDVNQIRLAGSDQALDVTWTSNTEWEVTLSEVYGTNTFTFEATRFNGDVVASDSITVTSPSNAQPQQDFLRITEFHYNPPGAGDATEFIELTNVGTATLDVSGAIISDGPSAEFVVPAGTSLAAGQSLVIAGDVVAFESAYPQVDTALLLGPFAGRLSNGGETLTLLDSSANEIMSVEYGDGTDDPWYPSTDGGGFTLVLDDPINTPVSELGQFFSWRASNEIGGNPGSFDIQPNPPAIVSFIRDGGSQDRPDLWTKLDVTFSKDVAISASALQLFNDSTGGNAVDLSGVGFSYDSGTRTATWDFSTISMFEAAFYTATLNADSVTAAISGLRLDGNGNGTGGDDYEAAVYVALPGDVNLDGDVDISDIQFVNGSIQNVGDASILLASLGNTRGQVWANGDLNGDGDVDISQIQITPVFANVGDASILLANLGSSVVLPATNAIAFSSASSSSGSSFALTSESSFVPVVVSATRPQLTTGERRLPASESSGELGLAGNQELDAAFAESGSDLGDDDQPASDRSNDDDLLVAELGEVELSIV